MGTVLSPIFPIGYKHTGCLYPLEKMFNWNPHLERLFKTELKNLYERRTHDI